MWLRTNYGQSRLSVENAAEVKKVSRQIDEYVTGIVASSDNFYKAGKSRAFVTMASPAYDFGLKALLASVRQVSGIPFVVLASRPWEFEADFKDVYFLAVPTLFNPKYTPDRFEHADTLTKLWIFGLLALERIVYLDADCLVQKSIDDLFDERGFCCAPDCVENAKSNRFNSGVMAFDPSMELRDFIYDGAYLAELYDHGDQGLLNSLLNSRVKYIPVEYNLTRHYSFFHGGDTAPRRLCIMTDGQR